MLQALGVVFLLVIAALAAGVAWLIYKIRRGMMRLERTAALADGLGGPQLLLEARASVAWPNREVVADLQRQATEAGASHIGDYAVPAMADTYLSAYAVESANAFLTVYDNPQLGSWIDVIVAFTDGRSYTVSTAKSYGPGAPRPPEDELQRFEPATAVTTLLTALHKEAIGRDIAPALADNFQSEFEAMCDKHRQYIASRPVSQGWLEAIAEEVGVELDGDVAADLDKYRDERRLEQFEAQCIKDLAASGRYSAAEWEAIRDHLVVVHDAMPADEVGDVFLENVDLDDDRYERAEKLNSGSQPARRAVARFNMTLAEHKRLKLVCTVDTPMEADIYVNQLEYSDWGDPDIQIVERGVF